MAASVGLDERITSGRILGESIGRIQAAAAPLALLWLAGGVLAAGFDLTLKAAGVYAETERFGPVAIAYNLALGVLDGTTTALGLRLLLGPPGAWRRWDRDFLEGTALFAAMTAVAGLSMFVMDAAPSEGVGLGVMVVLIGALAAFATKLVLWPTARVMGRTDVTPGLSWRRMRRATRGYLAAHVLVLIPFGVIVIVGPMSDERSDLAQAALDAMFVGFTIFSLTASATMYDLRVQRGTRLADVFS